MGITDRFKVYGDVARAIANGKYGTKLPENATIEDIRQAMLNDHREIANLPLSDIEVSDAFEKFLREWYE